MPTPNQHLLAGHSAYGDVQVSSSPIAAFDLDDTMTLEELRAAFDDVSSVLELHQADPVAAMEVWKAMADTKAKQQAAATAAQGKQQRQQQRSRRGSDVSTASTTTTSVAVQRALAAPPPNIPGMHRPTRRTDEVSAIVSRRRQEIAELHATSLSATSLLATQARDERQARLRRSSAYPQRMLLSMDQTVAACSATALQERAVAVEAESRRFESDSKRWRAAMEREPELPSVEEERQLQLLEGELLEAKLEDLYARAGGLEAAVRQQQMKHAVLLRHATKLLGAEVVDGEIPPVVTADDLRAQLKATLVDIRDTKYQREQCRQQQRRALNRIDRKVETLEADLAERQRKAVEEADRALSADDDRLALLQARYERRAATRLDAALTSLVSSEEAQRAELERAAAADLRVVRADVQTSLLMIRAKQSRDAANAAAVPMSETPAFAMAASTDRPTHSRSRGGGARGGGSRRP